MEDMGGREGERLLTNGRGRKGEVSNVMLYIVLISSSIFSLVYTDIFEGDNTQKLVCFVET